MMSWLTNTFLNIPIIIWVLQILYVTIALAILFFIYPKTNNKTFLIVYVIIMIIINIIWRMAIMKTF